MSLLEFNSGLSASIKRFICLRQAGGYDYQAQAQLLSYFDHFLVEQNFSKPPITRQIIEEYEKSLSHLAPRVRSNRMCVVRQLCQCFSRNTPHTYVPDTLTLSSSSPSVFKPAILSENEIGTLLAAAAVLPPSGSLRGVTYQTLFGVLYSTGIRIGEALALNIADFHNSDARLYVAQGKFRKARWLPLHDSTAKAIQRYVRQRKKIKPCSQDAPLFLNLRGRRFTHCTVCRCFHDLTSQCGIAREGRTHIRLHDLRHTFAVQRLLAWYHQDEDINAKLAWLATYMGHIDINHTHCYLQPTAQLLEQVNGRFHRHYVDHIKA